MREGMDTIRPQGSGMAPELAGFVLDLARGGVLAEVGEEIFDWFGAGEFAAVPAAAKVAAPLAAVVESVKMPMVAVKPADEAVVVAAAAEVWQAGTPGGVVVVQPGLPLQGEALLLVERMLDAVGCGQLPVAWVGVSGGEGATLRGSGVGVKIGAAVTALEAQRVLVLGGGMLQAWLGKPTGVEAWRPGGAEALPGLEKALPVGVTYAPDMLLAKPLFKRLAWKHLQAWAAACAARV